jgi:hypothetical protein
LVTFLVAPQDYSKVGARIKAMAGDFAYLIRFLDNEGKEYYGNLIEAKAAINLIGSKAQVVLGNPFDGLTVTDEEKTISKVYPPPEVVRPSG